MYWMRYLLELCISFQALVDLRIYKSSFIRREISPITSARLMLSSVAYWQVRYIKRLHVCHTSHVLIWLETPRRSSYYWDNLIRSVSVLRQWNLGLKRSSVTKSILQGSCWILVPSRCFSKYWNNFASLWCNLLHFLHRKLPFWKKLRLDSEENFAVWQHFRLSEEKWTRKSFHQDSKFPNLKF